MASILSRLSLRIRRRESPFYDRLYRIAKSLRGISVPACRPLHSLLYGEWQMRKDLWHNFWRVIYYEPMFKSQCASVGKNFHMEYAGNGSTRVHGNLRITLGSNVHIFDNTQFVGLKLFDEPELIVGDDTYLGPAVYLMVGKRITIGSHCMIGSRIITDNPGHSINVMRRLESGGGPPDKIGIRPVAVGDFCWLPLDTVVYPGVTIGDGVVVRMGTHIDRDVPPFCHAAGDPMRILRKLPIPEELRAVVGEERYNRYLQIHAGLRL